MTAESQSRQGNVTAEWLETVRSRLTLLLCEVEETFGENGAGTYPSEIEMTLRLACNAVSRGKEMASRAAF